MTFSPAAVPSRGRSESGTPHVVVIGGGISGLVAAHKLLEQVERGEIRAKVTLCEGSDRLGGAIRTVKDGEFLLESGPDTLVSHKPAGIELCRRLGLQDEIVELDAAKHRPHLLHRGRLIGVPTGFKMVAPTKLGPVFSSPLFSPWGKLRIAMERFVPARPASITADESMASFVGRRFGRELVDRVAQPVMGSLFAADTDRMSLAATVPQLRGMERRFGSLTRAMKEAAKSGRSTAHGLVALRGGMQQLVETLQRKIPASSLRLNARIERVERNGEGWKVALASGEAIRADVVVLACPAPVSSRLVRDLDEALADSLADIDYTDCATIHMAYDAADAKIPRNSFGFFAPKQHADEILACSFIHVKFPDRVPGGQIMLRAFAGGALQRDALAMDDETLIDRAHCALAGPLALRSRPRHARVFRHPSSMPQFEVGFVSKREWIASRIDGHPGLFACGGACGVLGLPDSIATGERAADRVLEAIAPSSARAAG